MATTLHPIHTPPGLRRVGLDDQPAPNLHLHAGIWQAACPTCPVCMVDLDPSS